MEAGKLNRQITIQKSTITFDSFNEPVKTWVDLCTVWTMVGQIGSKEVYQAQKIYSETSAVFTIRYSQRFRTVMRIKYAGRYFEILGIYDPDGKRVQLNIAAKEVVT